MKTIYYSEEYQKVVSGEKYFSRGKLISGQGIHPPPPSPITENPGVDHMTNKNK